MSQSDSTEGLATSGGARVGLVTSRREFLAEGLGLAACVVPAHAAAPPSETAGVTARTIEEAEKIHAVHFSPAQRHELAASVPAQVQSVVKLRRVPRPLTLQPAIHFDPRLPGARYPQQGNSVRLSSAGPIPLPQDDPAIAYAPVTHLSHWLGTGQLTSVRLTEIYLERIAGISPRLYCYITICADLARAQAKAMDAELKAGKYRGPLHGVPYSIKDVFDTAGIPTTWGCALYRNRVPTEDATIVRMLKECGRRSPRQSGDRRDRGRLGLVRRPVSQSLESRGALRRIERRIPHRPRLPAYAPFRSGPTVWDPFSSRPTAAGLWACERLTDAYRSRVACR